MSEDDRNPYTVPNARLDEEAGLAGRGARLAAAILDALIVGVLNVPMLFGLGVVSLENTDVGQAAQLQAGVVGFVVYVLLNGYFLATRGQSLGKMAVGVRIVDQQSRELIPLVKIVGLRILPFSALQMLLPVVGPLVGLIDALFIFGDSRRCLHDRLAGTVVVDVRASAKRTDVD